MLPENEWFRPPKMMEMCRRGDRRRFIWVAEPNKHGEVFGVGYEVSESLMVEIQNPDLNFIHSAARKELDKRIAAGNSHGQGCMWEAFEWCPVFRQLESGVVEVIE